MPGRVVFVCLQIVLHPIQSICVLNLLHLSIFVSTEFILLFAHQNVIQALKSRGHNADKFYNVVNAVEKDGKMIYA